MKLMTVLMLVCCMQISAKSVSQNVTLKVRDAPLTKVFNEIKKQTGYTFIYTESMLREAKPVSMKVNNATLPETLDICFSGQPFSYQIINETVVVEVAKTAGIALAAASFLSPTSVSPPPIEIKGRVTDENGNPLAGISVVLKGSSVGTTTNESGEYSLSLENGNGVLVFSSVGYTEKEIKVNGRMAVNAVMERVSSSLDQIVVVGYGSEKKENVIGSIATVKTEQILSSPVTQLSNALAGKLPGVITRQGDGLPGYNTSTILIRGRSTIGNAAPLVVIDGVADRDMNSLNPSDIESISILKDASAGIYGARAANGVILITTKGGNFNTAPSFDYRYSLGFNSPSKMAEMANAVEYAQMIREMQTYKNVDESNMIFSLEDIEKYRSGAYPWTHPNTDWFKETTKDHTTMNNHSLSLSGGTKNITYYSSFGYQFEDGIYKNSASSYNRYNLNVNVNAKVNQYLNLGVDLIGAKQDRNAPSRTRYDIWGAIRRGRPTDPAYYPNGLPGPDIEYGDNPVVISTDQAGFNHTRDYNLYNKFFATLKVPGIAGLELEGIFGYDKSFTLSKVWQKPFSLYSFNTQAYLNAGNTGAEDGSAFVVENYPKGLVPEPQLTQGSNEKTGKYYNFRVNYQRTFNGRHNLKAFIAMESQDVFSEGMQAYRRFYQTDLLPYLFAGGTEGWNNSGTAGIDGRLNYFGRVFYNYEGKYLLQFSFRRDGSLRFSKESGRWGNFPSVLAGWVMSKENFWQGSGISKYVNYLKLKASYGQLGNDAVNPFQYLASYGFGTGVIFGGQYSNGLSLTNTPNPNITWEIANIYNAGFESRLFNDKFVFNTDFFYQRRSNILVARNASVPSYTGLSLPDENYGIVDNKGFEIELGYSDHNGNFSYGINGNFAYAHNSIVEFDEPERVVPWQTLTGHPYGSILLYNAIGIFRDEEQINKMPHVAGARPGDIIIEDVSGDGEITTDDKIIFDKVAVPQTTFGVSFNIGYRNWSLDALIQGTGTTLTNMRSDDRTGTGGNYFKYEVEGRWTEDNKDASKPRSYEREEPYWRSQYPTSYNYQKNGYVRLKNITLSYNLPGTLLNRIMLKRAQLFLSGNNVLLLYSQNKIQDPETDNMQTYPIMKTYSLGVQIGF